MVESTDPNALPQVIYDWLAQQGAIPPPAAPAEFPSNLPLKYSGMPSAPDVPAPPSPDVGDLRNFYGRGGFQPVGKGGAAPPTVTIDPKTGRFTLSPPTFNTDWMHAANPIRAGIDAFLNATGFGPEAASASTSLAAGGGASGGSATPTPAGAPMPWQGNTAPEPWYSSWAGIRQAGRNLMGPGVPQPAGSTGPMPRVPPVPGASAPTMPGPGTAAATAAPSGAPPVAAQATPASAGATPAQIFATAAGGHGDVLNGGTPPVTPTPDQEQAPASKGMWDNLINDPNFEFGLRLMEASQPTPGTHRGPSIFAALAGAGLGQLQSQRAQLAATRQFALEQTKIQNDYQLRTLMADIDNRSKLLQNEIQAGQLQVAKDQLHATVANDIQQALDKLRLSPAYMGASDAQQSDMEQKVRDSFQGAKDAADKAPDTPAGPSRAITLKDGRTVQAHVENGKWVDSSGKPIQ